MTLPTSQRGRAVATFLAPEATPGVLPTTGWTPARFFSLTGGMGRPLVKDDQLGAGQANARDGTLRRQGLPGGSLSRTVPLNLNEFGYWLSAAFGRSSSGAASNYVHVFTSGIDPATTLALVQKYAANDLTWDLGVAVSSLRIQGQKAENSARATLQMVGLKDDDGGAMPTGTVASAMDAADFADWRWQALWNDVAVGSATGLDLNIDTGVERINGLSGDEWPTQHHFGDTSVTGTFRLYGSASTFRTLGKSGAPGKLTLKATHPDDPTNRYIKFEMAQTQFAKPQREVGGPGQLSTEMSFESSQTASAAALVVTLANGIASYAA